MAVGGLAAREEKKASPCGLSSCQAKKQHDPHAADAVKDAPVQCMQLTSSRSSRYGFARQPRLRTVYESAHEDEEDSNTEAGDNGSRAASYPCRLRALVQAAKSYPYRPRKGSKRREEHDAEMSTCDTLPDFDEEIVAAGGTPSLERTYTMLDVPSYAELMAGCGPDED